MGILRTAWRREKSLAALLVCGLFLASCDSDSCSDGSCSSSEQVVVSDLDLHRAPRISSSADGSAWLVWTEGASGGEAVTAARVSPTGEVSRWKLSPTPVDGAFDHQIAVAGSTPVATWVEVTGDTRRVRAAAWNGQGWTTEQTQESSSGVLLGASLLLAPTGDLHLVWFEDAGANGARLLSARRKAQGGWSAVQVIRTIAAGVQSPHGVPSVAVDGGGSVLAVWSEELIANTTDPQPQVLWSSRWDSQQGVWATAVQVDAGGRYGVVAVAPWRQAEWVVSWVVGDTPLGRRSLRAKRFLNGGWEADATRVDTDSGEEPREVVLSTSGSTTRVVWSAALTNAFGQSDGRSAVRAAQLDAASGVWSAPATLSAPSLTLPGGLHLQQRAPGQAVSVWGASTGPSGPWLASTDSSAHWLPAQSLDAPEWAGNAPDITPQSNGGWVATWYRWQSNAALKSVVVRRIP